MKNTINIEIQILQYLVIEYKNTIKIKIIPITIKYEFLTIYT